MSAMATKNPIFFYGLFMDQALLIEQGLDPTVFGPAVLPDYRIHIGQRATLVQCPGSRAFGVVMGLTEDEAQVLYSAPSVREYVPEVVQAELLESDERIEADCYNLPPEIGLAGTNPTYASQLARLARNLGLDPAYVEEIAAFSDGS